MDTKAYVFSFTPEKGKARIWQTKPGTNMEDTLAHSKTEAIKEYPLASGWCIHNPDHLVGALP